MNFKYLSLGIFMVGMGIVAIYAPEVGIGNIIGIGAFLILISFIESSESKSKEDKK